MLELIVAAALSMGAAFISPEQEDPPRPDKDTPQLVTRAGRVVAASKQTLTVVDKDGNESKFELSGDTKILIEGRAALPEALKPGMQVRVAATVKAPARAIKIEVNQQR